MSNVLCLHKATVFKEDTRELACADCGTIIRVVPNYDEMTEWPEGDYFPPVLLRDPPGTADPDAHRIPKVPSRG